MPSEQGVNPPSLGILAADSTRRHRRSLQYEWQSALAWQYLRRSASLPGTSWRSGRSIEFRHFRIGTSENHFARSPDQNGGSWVPQYLVIGLLIEMSGLFQGGYHGRPSRRSHRDRSPDCVCQTESWRATEATRSPWAHLCCALLGPRLHIADTRFRFRRTARADGSPATCFCTDASFRSYRPGYSGTSTRQDRIRLWVHWRDFSTG